MAGRPVAKVRCTFGYGTISCRYGGPVPATTVGGLAAAEFVLHGWDLARVTGVDAAWPDDVIAVAYEATAQTAEQGRAIGVYAPPVDLGPDASTMDRLLAVSGRNPQWTPPRA